MATVRSSFEIAKEVLDLIKSQVVSQNDIIPLAKLPFFVEAKVEEYKKIHGSEKIAQVKEHQIKLKKVRDKSRELLPLFLAKGIRSLRTTVHVAVSLCGVGECGETSNRALVELIKAGCTKPIRLIMTLGKARTPFPRVISDYYEHGFLIIGDVPSGWDKHTSLNAFTLLSDECVLLDPSLGFVGKAKDAEVLLKDIFSVYEMNRIASEMTFSVVPDHSHKDVCETTLKNAKELSRMIHRDLGLVEDEKNIWVKVVMQIISGAFLPGYIQQLVV